MLSYDKNVSVNWECHFFGSLTSEKPCKIFLTYKWTSGIVNAFELMQFVEVCLSCAAL